MMMHKMLDTDCNGGSERGEVSQNSTFHICLLVSFRSMIVASYFDRV